MGRVWADCSRLDIRAVLGDTRAMKDDQIIERLRGWKWKRVVRVVGPNEDTVIFEGQPAAGGPWSADADDMTVTVLGEGRSHAIDGAYAQGFYQWLRDEHERNETPDWSKMPQ